MSYVKYDVVARAVKYAMHRHRKLYYAEVGCEMSAVFLYAQNKLVAYFLREKRYFG
jgi:hypothetical protein